MTATMRAACQDLYGPALTVREVPVPTPGAGEVLVRVHAAGERDQPARGVPAARVVDVPAARPLARLASAAGLVVAAVRRTAPEAYAW